MKRILALVGAFGLALGAGWYASAQITVLPQTNVFAGIPNPKQYVWLFSDFFGDASNAVGEPFEESASGAGAACTSLTPADNTSFGIQQCSTGTTTTGFSLFGSSVSILSSIPLGTGTTTFQGRVSGPSALSDGTDTFTINSGFSDPGTVDSVHFGYTHSVTAGNWSCNTTSNSVASTPVNSGVAVAAGTWYTLGININAAGTNATFFINGNQVCSMSTNIPTGFARATAPLPLLIIKSAGTTARTMNIDYAQYILSLTSAR